MGGTAEVNFGPTFAFPPSASALHSLRLPPPQPIICLQHPKACICPHCIPEPDPSDSEGTCAVSGGVPAGAGAGAGGTDGSRLQAPLSRNPKALTSSVGAVGSGGFLPPSLTNPTPRVGPVAGVAGPQRGMVGEAAGAQQVGNVEESKGGDCAGAGAGSVPALITATQAPATILDACVVDATQAPPTSFTDSDLLRERGPSPKPPMPVRSSTILEGAGGGSGAGTGGIGSRENAAEQREEGMVGSAEQREEGVVGLGCESGGAAVAARGCAGEVEEGSGETDRVRAMKPP